MSMSILQLKDYSQDVPQVEPTPAKTDSPADIRKKIHQGFAATVAIGLAIASIYVGGRIVSAKTTRRAAPVVIHVSSLSQPVAPAKAVSMPSPALKPKDAAAPHWNIIEPRPGETYIQLAAIPLKTIDPFLNQIEEKGFRPVIARGPTDSLYRILIGPYARQDALKDAQTAVEAAGIQHIVRVY